jgi:hypothetical protein
MVAGKKNEKEKKKLDNKFNFYALCTSDVHKAKDERRILMIAKVLRLVEMSVLFSRHGVE